MFDTKISTTGTKRHGLKMDNQLTPQLLIYAYSQGVFPMADGDGGGIDWYSPDPRAIMPLDEFKVSRSLRKTIKSQFFDVRIDTAFEQVIRACANRESTWISEEIITAYIDLNKHGYAHSVESWSGNELAGGLYGVARTCLLQPP